MKSRYGWEQFTFWLRLWPRLRKGRFDVLHVQDPMLAYWCRRFRRMGLLKTKEILAHGTEEPAEWLAQFEYVQHLAPWHLRQALEALARRFQVSSFRFPSGLRASLRFFEGSDSRSSRRAKALHQGKHGAGQAHRSPERSRFRLRRARGVRDKGSRRRGAASVAKPHWVAIPNFVDTGVFRPAADAKEKAACRREFGLPEDAFVIGTSATVKRPHKRIDYLIREFAAFASSAPFAPSCGRSSRSRESSNHRIIESSETAKPFLLIAGASHPDSAGLVELAGELAPGRINVLLDLPRETMPTFYRALDLFVLVSLFEMVPISIMEALASGVPVVTNDIPHLKRMTGCGGAAVDLSAENALAAFLATANEAWIRETGEGARRHAEAMFSTEVVIGLYIDYYARVLGKRTDL